MFFFISGDTYLDDQCIEEESSVDSEPEHIKSKTEKTGKIMIKKFKLNERMNDNVLTDIIYFRIQKKIKKRKQFF